MLTLEKLASARRLLDQPHLPAGWACILPPAFGRDLAHAMGAPCVAFPRRRSARGRKRAIARNWRPVLHSGDRVGGAKIYLTSGPLTYEEAVGRAYHDAVLTGTGIYETRLLNGELGSYTDMRFVCDPVLPDPPATA